MRLSSLLGMVALALVTTIPAAYAQAAETQATDSQDGGEDSGSPPPGQIWGAAKKPTQGRAHSIGSVAAGCLAGAVALPPDGGSAYQILRPSRNRAWSHPRTVAFVRNLARQVASGKKSGPLLIGDMSQPRGGPMLFGHGSHQTGLDVDIWFLLPKARLAPQALANPQPISMVNGVKVNRSVWGGRHLRLLELAAKSPEVDRIFVNPAIKVEACRTATGDRRWLGKLRPWWGHDEHFHVRLSCTEGDEGCVPQAPLNPDDEGCGAELASWNRSSKVLTDTVKDRPNHRHPTLPEACSRVLE